MNISGYFLSTMVINCLIWLFLSAICLALSIILIETSSGNLFNIEESVFSISLEEVVPTLAKSLTNSSSFF